MENKGLPGDRKQLFSRWMLGVCILGLCLNLLLSNLVIKLQLPLYIDNVGSILVAALGGALPGMCIGFLTNLINSFNNPISMYYGILTAVIAFLAAQFSQRGYFKNWHGCSLMILCFVFIGGGVGSCMTWYLYGGGIGEGVSAPLALAFVSWGLPDFWAQLLADLILDLPDKLITVLLTVFILRRLPDILADKLPLSYLYAGPGKKFPVTVNRPGQHYRQHSISTKIVTLIVISSVIISGAAIAISSSYYSDKLLVEYQNIGRSASRQMAFEVDPEKVDQYIREGDLAPGYLFTKRHIENILISTEGLTYAYVYQIKEDGCHVVFDIDTKDTPAAKPGEVEPFDEGFLKYKEALLAGKEIPPVVTNDKYGNLMTTYTPIKNNAGKTVAYAGVDINMEQFIQDMRIFIIKMLALSFGITMLMCALAILYAEKLFIRPIATIVGQTEAFDKTQPENWLDSKAWQERKQITSGDELEELYETVSRVQENISVNVKERLATEQKLKQTEEIKRQAGIIASKNKELAEAMQRADEANAAKSTFLSQVSHDMRTPMNGILGLAELSKDQEMSPEVRTTFAKIETSGRYLLSLINDTLDMNKIEAGKVELHPETVLFGKFTNSLTDLLEAQLAAKKIHFLYHLDEKLAGTYVHVDALRLQQVFFNLLANAIKFTPTGGNIDFLTTVLSSDAKSFQVQTVVRDNGIGMSEEFVRNGLFKPFSQEEHPEGSLYQGTGLGMAISKNLVLLMGGTISVYSRQGEGTTFTVQLPIPAATAAEEAEYQKRNAVVPAAFTALRGKRILLCEDHPLNVEITTKLLQRQGVTVESAVNGLIGVKMFSQAAPGYYDLILMDVRMPVLNGLEATRRIRGLARIDAAQIPIIAMTANAYDTEMRECYDAGMNDHLLKPVDLRVFYGMLCKYLC